MFKEIELAIYLCKLFILLDHQQFLIPVKGKTKSSRVLYPLENYHIQPFKAMDPAQLRLYGTLCVLVFINAEKSFVKIKYVATYFMRLMGEIKTLTSILCIKYL